MVKGVIQLHNKFKIKKHSPHTLDPTLAQFVIKYRKEWDKKGYRLVVDILNTEGEMMSIKEMNE